MKLNKETNRPLKIAKLNRDDSATTQKLATDFKQLPWPPKNQKDMDKCAALTDNFRIFKELLVTATIQDSTDPLEIELRKVDTTKKLKNKFAPHSKQWTY